MNMKTSEYLEIFECSQRKELSPKTVNRKIYEVSKFFEYLDKQGIQSLENFDIRHVYDYLNSLDYGIIKKYGAKKYEKMKGAEAAATAYSLEQVKSYEPRQTPPNEAAEKKNGGSDLKTVPPSQKQSR